MEKSILLTVRSTVAIFHFDVTAKIVRRGSVVVISVVYLIIQLNIVPIVLRVLSDIICRRKITTNKEKHALRPIAFENSSG